VTETRRKRKTTSEITRETIEAGVRRNSKQAKLRERTRVAKKKKVAKQEKEAREAKEERKKKRPESRGERRNRRNRRRLFIGRCEGCEGFAVHVKASMASRLMQSKT
jgi:hypothetical protein